MTDKHDDDHSGTFASPPCYMHEIDPAYMNLAPVGDARQYTDLRRWRKAERERLIKQRLALTVAIRRQHSERIIANLHSTLGNVEGLTISTYWPFRGEPDLRPLVSMIESLGGRCALPVVVEPGNPLIFRAWASGEPLTRGIWNIPIPQERAERLVPDVVIAPVIGFDRACYRLGYGGGYYDRTLAAMAHKPRLVGVGFKQAAIPTIYPQWHDIPMHAVITEDEVVTPATMDGAM